MNDDNAPTIVSTRSPGASALSSSHTEGAFQADLTRYELKDKLGAGGMAAVYRAKDRVTGGTVALKIIENGDGDESREARFLREVKAAGRLVHPNICRVLSFGRAHHQLFMAMELVDGLTLQKMIKARGTMPVPVALEALRQLLAALACAHAAGVVHRDLKPANVMVTPDGTLKLLDFGIAKSQEDATVTATGLLIGTPAFMAPEQILGSKTDARSDLFSAGVTFLVALTGRTRFSGMEPATVMVKVTSEPVPSLLEDCPTASTPVDRFLQKLCAQEADARYQSAEEALDALAAVDDLPADRDGPALLARYAVEPDVVAVALARACAARALARADQLLRMGPAAQPAAALALYRASLLDPSEDVRDRLARVCADAALTFDPIEDAKIAEATAAFEKTPNAPGVLKRLADLYRARGNVLLASAFLTRYLRVKPGDSHASMQLQVLLEGPAPSAPAAPSGRDGTGERLRTRDIVAGIRTGGQVQPVQPIIREPLATAPTLARPSAIGLRPMTSQQRSPTTQSPLAQGQGRVGAQPAPAIVVAEAPSRPNGISVHPLLLVVGAVLVAGLVFAIFGRFVRTTVDDVQLAVSDNEHRIGQAEEANITRLRKNYLDEAEGHYQRGNWAAAARQVNLLLATNPPAEQALAGMWIRAQCRLKLDDKRSARIDLEEYVKQTPLGDPHRDEAKKILDDIYAAQAAAAAAPDLSKMAPPAPATPAGGGLY